MINISIIREGRTILDKDITGKDVIKTCTKASMFFTIFILVTIITNEPDVDYSSLIFEESIKAIKWR